MYWCIRIGHFGSAVCIYSAEQNDQDSLLSVFSEDLIDYTPPLPDPLPEIENIDSTCAPRSDERSHYVVESSIDIQQIGPDPIIVLNQHR